MRVTLDPPIGESTENLRLGRMIRRRDYGIGQAGTFVKTAVTHAEMIGLGYIDLQLYGFATMPLMRAALTSRHRQG